MFIWKFNRLKKNKKITRSRVFLRVRASILIALLTVPQLCENKTRNYNIILGTCVFSSRVDDLRRSTTIEIQFEMFWCLAGWDDSRSPLVNCFPFVGKTLHRVHYVTCNGSLRVPRRGMRFHQTVADDQSDRVDREQQRFTVRRRRRWTNAMYLHSE